MYDVIFIGQNPSKHNIDVNVAFVGSKSYLTLKKWIQLLGTNNVGFINASKKIGKVTLKDIDYDGLYSLLYYPKAKVIFLGNYAEKAYNKAFKGLNSHSVYKIDHPSPLNRKLNNYNYIDNMLRKCGEFLTS